MTKTKLNQADGVLKGLQKIPNVGPSIAKDLVLLGITEPSQLKDRDPDDLWRELSARTGQRQDPCVRDVFEAAIRFSRGEPAQPWWAFTAGRKERDKASKSFSRS